MDAMLSFVDGCEMTLDASDGAQASVPLPVAREYKRPKRVRCRIREIEALRHQREALEQQLVGATARAQREMEPAESQRLAIQTILWRRVVERERRRRVESENENNRLQTSIRKLMQVQCRFKSILSAVPSSPVSAFATEFRLNPLLTHAPSLGFTSQLAHASSTSSHRAPSSVKRHKDRLSLVEQQVAAIKRAYLRLDTRLRAPGFSSLPTVASDVQIVHSSVDQLVLDVRAQRELTFDLPTASRSIWQFFAGKTIHQVFRQEEVRQDLNQVEWLRS